MNREIKFRAWDKLNNKMIDYLVTEGNCLNLSLGANLGEDKRFTLMQFTGLKDKNGKEIWEGDILGWWGGRRGHPKKGASKGRPWPVGFDEQTGGWGLRYLNEESYDGKVFNNIAFKLSRALARKKEIIGNIYENRELSTNQEK